jgi:cellular nucleic acid-binding protein
MDLLVSKKLDVGVLNATMEYIYTLQLSEGKYYVGKSSDPDARYMQHKNGLGASWTKKYRPVKLLDTKPLTGEHDETNTTKDLMKKYGVDNVCGGAYATISLDDATKSVLEREIRGNTDKCYKCGNSGHFANKCSSSPKVEVVWKRQEEVVWECEYCPKQFKSRKMCESHEQSCGGQANSACYRCGRTSHYANNCFAKSHIDGYGLSSDEESDDYSD